MTMGAQKTAARSDRIIPVGWARFLYGCVFIVAIALLFVHVTTPKGWKVDNTAVGLLAILIFLPLIEQIRSFSGFGVEVGLGERVAQVEQNLELVSEQSQREAAAAGGLLAETEPEAEPAAEMTSRVATDAFQPIDRIVWVDDQPSNNATYIEELEKRFQVITAESTQQGLEIVAQAPARHS